MLYMDEFITSIIKNIIDKWDKIPYEKKEKTREELINTFICFVGEGKQCEKKLLFSIHLN